MDAFKKFFDDTFEIVEVIKSDEKNFIARVFDKNSKKLCVMKKRGKKSAEVYKILKSVENSHIPQIYRIFEREENLILIEENIEGQTLEEILHYREKNFDEDFVTKIFLQICDCLEKIHEKNIIHRDLKLSNIMLTKNNFVKIIDFGIARIFDPEKISDTEFLGTRGYAAPEQYGLFNLEQSDNRTDIFNLGVTIKNLLGENYRGRLEKILNRCTNLNPDLRYQKISELIRDIKRTKKIFYLKRASLIFFGAIIFFAASQFINFENKNESPSVEVEEKFFEEKKIPAEEKISAEEKIQAEKIEFPEIKFPEEAERSQGEQAERVFEVPQITFPEKISDTPKTENLPAPVEKIPEKPQQKKYDRAKLFLYINGQLTENRGEHTTDGDFYITENFQNWQLATKGKYYKWFLYPSHWTARLKIENFTEKDLIAPKIEVNFSGEKIFIDHPTIQAGQVAFVDIPIANKRALNILGPDHFHGTISIAVKSSDNKKNNAFLHRDLEIEN